MFRIITLGFINPDQDTCRRASWLGLYEDREQISIESAIIHCFTSDEQKLPTQESNESQPMNPYCMPSRIRICNRNGDHSADARSLMLFPILMVIRV